MFGAYTFAWAMLAVVFGFYIVVNTIKSATQGEGMYDGNRSRMTMMNWLTAAIGIAMAGWGGYTLLRYASLIL